MVAEDEPAEGAPDLRQRVRAVLRADDVDRAACSAMDSSSAAASATTPAVSVHGRTDSKTFYRLIFLHCIYWLM